MPKWGLPWDRWPCQRLYPRPSTANRSPKSWTTIVAVSPPSSNGQDAALSRLKSEFDSPWRHYRRLLAHAQHQHGHVIRWLLAEADDGGVDPLRHLVRTKPVACGEQ